MSLLYDLKILKFSILLINYQRKQLSRDSNDQWIVVRTPLKQLSRDSVDQSELVIRDEDLTDKITSIIVVGMVHVKIHEQNGY